MHYHVIIILLKHEYSISPDKRLSNQGSLKYHVIIILLKHEYSISPDKRLSNQNDVWRNAFFAWIIIQSKSLSAYLLEICFESMRCAIKALWRLSEGVLFKRLWSMLWMKAWVFDKNGKNMLEIVFACWKYAWGEVLPKWGGEAGSCGNL